MMKRARTMLAALICSCASVQHRPPPGPSPIPLVKAPAAVPADRIARAAIGEAAIDDHGGIAPNDAALLAVEHNPHLRATRAQRGIERSELIAAGVLPNPRISGSLDAPTTGRDAEVLAYGVELSWNVTPLLARGDRVDAAQERLASVDLEIAWQEWEISQAARLHAVRCIYLARRAQVARELEAALGKQQQALEGARAAGAVSELETSNAARAAAEARVDRLELEQQLAAERAELGRAIGADATRTLALDDTWTARATTPARDPLLTELPRRRLDLIALQRAHLSHDLAASAAALSQLPPVEIGFQTRREVDGNGSVGVTLAFELPAFDRNQATVQSEQAQRAQIDAEYDARLFEARADVARAAAELAIASDQLTAAKQAADAATALAERASTASAGAALNPLLAADILERSFQARLRALEIEQTSAELYVALALAAGVSDP